MNDYSRGAWEALNYVIRFLEKVDKETALREFRALKEEIEKGVAIDFQKRVYLL